MLKNRYAGISPFSTEQRDVFFGREKDIVELHELILLEKQVLLYSKSGIGKTSLLNAGVIPLLEEINNFTILKIRFKAYDENNPVRPLQRILDEFINLKTIDLKQNTILDQIVLENNNSLWYFLKKIQLIDKSLKLIFIFDQFEELFSYPNEEITEFKNQFYEILNGEIPPQFFSEFGKNRELISSENMNFLYEKIDIKTVFVIRIDKLSELNRLSDRIPNIQKSFYELLPLNKTQTKEAILNPVKIEGDFNCPKFDYSEEAVTKIIDFLSNNFDKSIETTQLQLICQEIEEIVIKKSKLSNSELRIELHHLPKFEDLFFTFYEESIKKLPENIHKEAFIFVEDLLIRNNQRISLDENICPIEKKYLEILVDSRLLRSEFNSFGRINYELTHDTLVTPIITNRTKRMHKEAEEQKLKELNKLLVQKQRQRKIKIIIIFSALICFGFGIFGMINMKIANQQKNLLKKEQFNKNLEDAKDFQNQALYELAVRKYKDADSLIHESYIFDSINSCIKKLLLKSQFDNYDSIATFYFDNSLFLNAKIYYDSALFLGYNNLYITEKRNNNEILAIKYYLEKIKKKYYQTNYTEMKLYLDSGLLISPDNSYLLSWKNKLKKEINSN